ncbi:carbohydrate-binding protein [Streptomyces sp. NPDC054940]
MGHHGTAAGTYTLRFRYANYTAGKGGTDRPLAVTVDGGKPTTLPFMPTGGWDTWEVRPVVVELSAGAHTVRATATGYNGPNVDHLAVSAGVVGTVDANSRHTARVTRDGSYLQVVPVGRSGFAFLGDAGKFVSLGRQRIAEPSDDGRVRATVAFADGEGPVTLHGYSPADVPVSATGGRAGDVTYDSAAVAHLDRPGGPGEVATRTAPFNVEPPDRAIHEFEHFP